MCCYLERMGTKTEICMRYMQVGGFDDHRVQTGTCTYGCKRSTRYDGIPVWKKVNK